MRSGGFMFLAVLALGCGDKDETGDSQADTAQETGAQDIVWPDGDRVLLHTGHGGVTGKTNGWGVFDDVDDRWKQQYGWNTDVYDTLPEDLSPYRVIAFVGPGVWADDTPFTEQELLSLRGAMEAGARMVVLTEVDNCASSTVNGLLEGLGAGMRFSGDVASDFLVVDPIVVPGSQLTEGVGSLQFSDPCFIDLNGADYAAHTEGDVIVAMERPGRGGDVVAIGDFEFMDDSGPLQVVDNAVFADRLVEVVPGFTP